MAGSVNRAIILGNLGKDPETRFMANGKPVCSFSVATSESWKDQSGAKQERVQWHNVVIFSEGLCKIAGQYLKKGSKVFLEGQIQTRSYEKDGSTRYVTEIVLQGFSASLVLLDSKPGSAGGFDGDQGGYDAPGGDFEDSIPF